MNRGMYGHGRDSYKLWKHITKALQVRSAAIQSVLDKYNSIAGVMCPHRCILKWEEVVEYAFLLDFNLLRDGCQDISQLPWASPMGHHAMDLHQQLNKFSEMV